MTSFTRRTVIGSTGAMLLASRVSATGALYDLIIVGAGAAGIAAARTARKAGRSVLMLESRAEVGGRARTNMAALGIPFDVGAAWLHNSPQNPLTSFARVNGVAINSSSRESLAFRAFNTDITQAVGPGYAAAEARLEKRIASIVRTGKDKPLADVPQTPKERLVTDLLCAADIAARPSEVSVVDIADADDTGDVLPAGGVGTLLLRAASGLELRTNASVSHVDTSRSGVRVSGNFGIVEGRACIVTLPTNLLARDRIAFFPALPNRVRDAFSALPLGLMLKVGLCLTRPLVSATEYAIGHAVLLTGRPHALHINLQSGLVTVLTSANWAEDVSRGGSAAKAAFARDVLRDTFGSSALTSIAATAFSSWDEDPNATGAYSHALPGRSTARAALDEIVDGKLAFAGEANEGSQSTTIGGAWLSGERAAKVLAKLGS